MVEKLAEVSFKVFLMAFEGCDRKPKDILKQFNYEADDTIETIAKDIG